MIEVWVLIMFCLSIAHCDNDDAVVFARVFETEQQCHQIGNELIKHNGRFAFGHTALCVKGVR